MQDNEKNVTLEKYNDEIDIKELFNTILINKFLVSVITSFITIAFVFYSLSLPNLYQSKAILVPVESSQGIKSSFEGYQGLASLAGLSLPSSASIPNSAKALKKIKSLSFFEEYFLPNINIPDLMAVESWDEANNSLKYDSRIYDVETGKWLINSSHSFEKSTSSQEGYKVFINDHLTIENNEKTGFIIIKIKHQSPYIAHQWVRLLIKQINLFYKEKDKNEADTAVSFLNNQMARTNFSEIKQVLAILLQKEIQKLTLIEASESYVFEYVDPPAVMEKRSEPNRLLISILGFILGSFLGIVIVLFKHYAFNKKDIV